MKQLIRVRPSIGGSGTFRGPMGGHFSYQTRSYGQYFIPNSDTHDWQDMHYPINTRKILDYQINPAYKAMVVDNTPQPTPIPIKYYRARTRIQ